MGNSKSKHIQNEYNRKRYTIISQNRDPLMGPYDVFVFPSFPDELLLRTSIDPSAYKENIDIKAFVGKMLMGHPNIAEFYLVSHQSNNNFDIIFEFAQGFYPPLKKEKHFWNLAQQLAAALAFLEENSLHYPYLSVKYVLNPLNKQYKLINPFCFPSFITDVTHIYMNLMHPVRERNAFCAAQIARNIVELGCLLIASIDPNFDEVQGKKDFAYAVHFISNLPKNYSGNVEEFLRSFFNPQAPIHNTVVLRELLRIKIPSLSKSIYGTFFGQNTAETSRLKSELNKAKSSIESGLTSRLKIFGDDKHKSSLNEISKISITSQQSRPDKYKDIPPHVQEIHGSGQIFPAVMNKELSKNAPDPQYQNPLHRPVVNNFQNSVPQPPQYDNAPGFSQNSSAKPERKGPADEVAFKPVNNLFGDTNQMLPPVPNPFFNNFIGPHSPNLQPVNTAFNPLYDPSAAYQADLASPNFVQNNFFMMEEPLLPKKHEFSPDNTIRNEVCPQTPEVNKQSPSPIKEHNLPQQHNATSKQSLTNSMEFTSGAPQISNINSYLQAQTWKNAERDNAGEGFFDLSGKAFMQYIPTDILSSELNAQNSQLLTSADKRTQKAPQGSPKISEFAASENTVKGNLTNLSLQKEEPSSMVTSDPHTEATNLNKELQIPKPPNQPETSPHSYPPGQPTPASQNPSTAALQKRLVRILMKWDNSSNQHKRFMEYDDGSIIECGANDNSQLLQSIPAFTNQQPSPVPQKPLENQSMVHQPPGISEKASHIVSYDYKNWIQEQGSMIFVPSNMFSLLLYSKEFPPALLFQTRTPGQSSQYQYQRSIINAQDPRFPTNYHQIEEIDDGFIAF